MSLRSQVTYATPCATLRAVLFALSLLVFLPSCQGSTEESGAVAAMPTQKAPKPPPRKRPDTKPASAPTSQPLSGCQLLTEEEVSQILGVELKQGRRAPPSCEWSNAKTKAKVTFDLKPAKHAQMLRFSAKEIVPDLGDDAYLSMRAPGVVVLTVIQGEKAFTFSVVLPYNRSFEEKDSIAAAKKLAEVILTRL